jgi:hypothetical protein
MLKIIATYTGPNEYRGFRNWETYELYVVGHQVIRTDDLGRMTYNSLESFFRDWIVTGMG